MTDAFPGGMDVSANPDSINNFIAGLKIIIAAEYPGFAVDRLINRFDDFSDDLTAGNRRIGKLARLTYCPGNRV